MVERALDTTPVSESAGDAAPGIRVLLESLGDERAELIPEDELGEAAAPPPSGLPTAERIGDVLVVELPDAGLGGLVGSDEWRTYIDTGLGLLEEHADACGFVIDVTANPGAAVSTLVGAVGPLLGEGTHVTYTDRFGETVEAWGWDGRAVTAEASEGSLPSDLASGFEATAVLDAAPVVVLTGPGTGGSAAGLVVAFSGRDQTVSIGEATSESPTIAKGRLLDAGGALAFTRAAAVDRTGQVYEAPIDPDLVVDPAMARAAGLDWLSDSVGCSAGTG